MIPLSCVNCCFNPLQTDSVGLRLGYCVEHRRVLAKPEATTCGRLFRKDLMFPSAKREQETHEQRFSTKAVLLLATGQAVNGAYASNAPAELATLDENAVGSAVLEYGQLGAKIESLSQLKAIPGAGAEIALLSLGRTYVRRCTQNGGPWTSGLHLFWWIKRRLAEEPQVRVEDLRESRPMPASRQLDLAKWSIVMLRLTFLSDVGQHASATTDSVRKVRNLAEDAALATGELSFSKLMRWVRNEGQAALNEALPWNRYAKLSQAVHKDDPASAHATSSTAS